MTPIKSRLSLNRFVVFCKGSPAYDEKFHSGVNIIRGENSSGKSTIADFISSMQEQIVPIFRDVLSLCYAEGLIGKT